MKANEAYWRRYAKRYDDFADFIVGRQLRQAIFHRLREEKDLGELVECGCGTGFYTAAVAANAASVLATDICDEMLAAARTNLQGLGNVRYQRADCEELALPEGSFDTVLMANVLLVLAAPSKAIREARRVLRRGGRLLVICYSDFGLDLIQVTGIAIKFQAAFGLPPPYGLKNYSPAELAKLVKDAGFDPVTTEVIGEGVKGIFVKALLP